MKTIYLTANLLLIITSLIYISYYLIVRHINKKIDEKNELEEFLKNIKKQF